MTEQARAVVIEGRGIVKTFRATGMLRRRAVTRALDGIDIDVHEGEVVALIGESGSGKTTLGKVLLRLTKLDEGTVLFDGVDVYKLGRGALRERRRAFQMVFQNPSANLHPMMSVRQMLDESLRLHRPELDAAGRRAHADPLLERVGMLARADQKPGSLSGGERRRAGLARILATRPRLIVADEPTSGLDAAIKLSIIDLLKTLKEAELTYLLISHDLGLVRRISERVLVMLKGRIIEEVPAERLGGDFEHHPYTGKLMHAADLLEERRESLRDRRSLPRGFNPATLERAAEEDHGGCVHAADCQLATRLGILDRCLGDRPPPVALAPGHWVACFGVEGPPEDHA